MGVLLKSLPVQVFKIATRLSKNGVLVSRGAVLNFQNLTKRDLIKS